MPQATDTPRPSVGRTVHYVAPGSADGRFPPAHRAAIITEAIDDHASLAVLNPTGIHFNLSVPYDGSDNPAPFTWHWPERV